MSVKSQELFSIDARMNFIPVLCLLFAATYATDTYDFQSIIDEVNTGSAKWTAGHNFDPTTKKSDLKRLMGAMKYPGPITRKHKTLMSKSDIPDEFDSRTHWPQCPTISEVADQSTCGSCWAVAAASAFSDRVCVATNGTFNKGLSADQLLSCCSRCGKGCEGGYPYVAWMFFQSDGLVTGGGYESKDGCQPYEFPVCDHRTNGSHPQCSTLPDYDTPDCKTNCTNLSYEGKYADDKHYTKDHYLVLPNEDEIKAEILTNGPVEAAFDVYEDFLNYNSGVYHHVTGIKVGGHAVRIIGWGVEDDTPYWLVTNSWNEDWGDKGLFKILRGKNECDFEASIVAGLPKV